MSISFRYTPQLIDLDHKLKPFIPDFIPAVGDIDAFLKVESEHPKNDFSVSSDSSIVLTVPLISLTSSNYLEYILHFTGVLFFCCLFCFCLLSFFFTLIKSFL